MIKYPLYVTLDTNIVVANKFDFSKNSTLGLLAKYVAAGKIKIVLSNIVIKEIEKHAIAEGKKICGDLRKLRTEVLKTASDEYLKQVGLDVPLQILDKKVYEEKSRNVWKEFLATLKPEILDTSKIDLDAIIDDYFNIKPPFENSDKKRKEFPDAFIANQIRERFGKEYVVAIISDDNGFKRACGNSVNHLFYKTLGDLYDAMNRQEEEYLKLVNDINSLMMSYISEIDTLVMEDECVEVHGLSYDKDGIVSGFDYSDISVLSITNTACKVRTIDEITEETVLATLLCTADINVECSYEDYDNAIWDKETESYYFLETKKNCEKHSARFGIRIEMERKTESLKIIPFKVILNGDTRREWFELVEDDSEMDIINQDREDLGFYPLDRYSDYLEEDLSESSFKNSVISVFEQINSLFQEYEDIATVYDEFSSSVKNSKSKDIIKKIAISMKTIEAFPMPSNLDKISDEEVEEIMLWVDQSYDRLSGLSEQASLPDTFSYGETIKIHNGKDVYNFVISELRGNVFAGDEELINLVIKNKDGNDIAKGYVRLTVGYLDFNEDGGAGDGIEDDIEYYCEDIVNTLENIANSIHECIKDEWAVAKIIETVIKE